MKRIISTLLIVVTLLTCCLTSLTGCFLNNGPIDDFVMPEGGFDTESEITIVFYHQMGQALQGFLATAIEDFKQLYPNITVVPKHFDDYDVLAQKINKEISVGAQPNLAICYADHVASYNMGGAVQSLNALISSTVQTANEQIGYTQEQIDDFIGGYWEEGYGFGDGTQMYTLPLYKSTEVLYYNKSFFDGYKRIYESEILIDMKGDPILDKNGNTQPNPNYHNENYNISVPTTWDEMEEVCRKIRENEGETYIPLGYDSEANWFITMCEQLGSPYTSLEEYNNFQFDNETNRNFVKKFRTWFLNKWVTTQTLNGGAYTSALFTGKDNTTKTRCVMCIGSTGGATYQTPGYTTVEGKNVYDFEVGIAPIPQEYKAAPKVISQGPSLCIFKKANPQEVLASYLFAKFLTTDYSFQGSVSMNNGYTPVIKSIQEVPAYKEWLDSASTANIQALAVKTTFENADSMYTSPAFWGSSTARTEVGKLMAACLAIESDVGLDAAIKERFENAVYVCKHSIGQ